ncbi:MAG TPA: hypothetical protein ENI20_00555 [Bacteroides sp.]|nr:hypothetical protein [Bacteroides sp.]
MTATNNISWNRLTQDFDEGLNETLQQQFHAAQFIALVGKHLIPQREDDSNTNLQYQAPGERFVGNKIPGGFRIALHLHELKLQILDVNDKVAAVIPLIGRTKTEIFGILKQQLEDSGVDVSSLTSKMHYEVPEHKLDSDASFSLNAEKHIKENIYYRGNAEIILNTAAAKFPKAEPVRIWPHHFDTGSFVPLEMNEAGGVSRSMGLGWAIPDTMVDEPYYYLSYWSEVPVENFNSLPDPDTGKWMRTGWNGGILRISEILKATTAEEQLAMVESFFNSGIKILFEHISL